MATSVAEAKVLDLGCGTGNPLSLWLAERAKEYVAIDLSESRIEILSDTSGLNY